MNDAAARPIDLATLDTLTVKSGELSLEVCPELAGRVTRLVFQGVDLYVGPEVNPNNWGATYWTSPQADWGWPPVVEVDSAAYILQGEVSGDWEMVSPLAHIGERAFVVRKSFRAGPHVGTIDALYTIENRGEQAFSMANWEIARVFGGGLTFFPTGEHELSPIAPHQFMPTEKAAGCTFYDHALARPGHCEKLHADGKRGYLAHLMDSSQGSLLLLKLFVDTPSAEQAPGEGECEIFANEDCKYVEIEVQGPYRSIAPGQRSTLTVRTVVVPLPVELDVAVREDLVSFADAQARHYGAPDLTRAV